MDYINKGDFPYKQQKATQSLLKQQQKKKYSFVGQKFGIWAVMDPRPQKMVQVQFFFLQWSASHASWSALFLGPVVYSATLDSSVTPAHDGFILIGSVPVNYCDCCY